MTPFIRWVDEHEATGTAKQVYDDWRSHNPDRDRVPHILKCFSLRPDFMRHMVEGSYGLHFADGFLTRRQKELIGTYVSALNETPYCRGSHAYFLECQVGPRTADAMRRADLDALPADEVTDAERELLRFAAQLTRESHTIRRQDVERLRDAGWNDKEIAEAVYVTAMFALFNRIANAFGLEDPNYATVLGGKDVPNRPAYRDETAGQKSEARSSKSETSTKHE